MEITCTLIRVASADSLQQKSGILPSIRISKCETPSSNNFLMVLDAGATIQEGLTEDSERMSRAFRRDLRRIHRGFAADSRHYAW